MVLKILVLQIRKETCSNEKSEKHSVKKTFFVVTVCIFRILVLYETCFTRAKDMALKFFEKT